MIYPWKSPGSYGAHATHDELESPKNPLREVWVVWPTVFQLPVMARLRLREPCSWDETSEKHLEVPPVIHFQLRFSPGNKASSELGGSPMTMESPKSEKHLEDLWIFAISAVAMVPGLFP